MAKTINIDCVFYVNGVSKSEDRDPKADVTESYRFEFIDDKNKNKKNDGWIPSTYACITIINSVMPSIEFGKKYKITLTEV